MTENWGICDCPHSCDCDDYINREYYQPYLPGLGPSGLNTEAAAQILKDKYLPWIRDQFFNQTSVLLREINVRANHHGERSGDADSSP